MTEKTLTTLRVGASDSEGTAEQLTDAIRALTRPGTIALDNVPVRLDGRPIISASIILDQETGDHFVNLTSEQGE